LVVGIKRMPTRLVPVAVAAVLFGLAGLQDPIARDPFGAATIAVDYGQLAAIWRDERAQLVADAEAVAACLADGVPDCAAAATLLDIVTEAKRYQGKALIAHINRAINLLIRPTPGAWVGALEVLRFADGDCKEPARTISINARLTVEGLVPSSTAMERTGGKRWPSANRPLLIRSSSAS
jgi:hypothetical protein